LLRRLVVAAVAAAVLPVQSSAAQSVRPRSADYLLAASANEVRALWVNPAGLATVVDASVMAEFVLERPVGEGLRLAQWTLGLNSRGISVGYQRDRFEIDPNTGALRFGLAVPFRRGSLGAAMSFYRGSAVEDVSHRGIDLGIRYRPGMLPVDLAAVLQNIGRPTPRDVKQPLTGILAANVSALASHVHLGAEVVAAERLAASGFDMTYRGALRLSLGGSLPFAAMSTVDLNGDLRLRQWAVGLVVGGRDRGVLLGSGPAGSGMTRLERMSLTGVSSRQF